MDSFDVLTKHIRIKLVEREVSNEFQNVMDEVLNEIKEERVKVFGQGQGDEINHEVATLENVKSRGYPIEEIHQ